MAIKGFTGQAAQALSQPLMLLPLLLLLPLTSAAISNYSGHQQSTATATAAPATRQEARLLDGFNHRYPDGSYEYRFELNDGTARYERGYFAMIDQVKTLMVVGYYSYRMPDGRYLTVFYNADQYGYRQNQSITPQVYPNLPRSIDVPASYNETTTRQHQQQQQQQQQHSHHSSSHYYATSTVDALPHAYASTTAALPTRKTRY